MKVGAIEIVPLLDGNGREPARTSLTRPGTPDPWACHEHLLDQEGNLALAVGGFLLRTGARTIVIDAGVGTIDNGRYKGGRFPESLRAAGVAPEDVTDVVFTHLHFDHVGWATQKGTVFFPNATYRVHAADWHHFLDGEDAEPGAVRKLSPLAERWSLFTEDTTLAPGLDTRHAPGHTPGTTVFVVSSQGQRALLLGDVAHSIVELTEPDWEAVFDVDPAAARAVRNTLSDELVDGPDALVGAHFPNLHFGRLVTTAGERRFIPL
ncbi:MBL fold metallo-hydrolase [Streptomyces sp. DASNCL29]|uniref:MBL fold metallo-hydrolase n=1 Tax=Streptomyces sp. DASNCL29 TaxID=2583819 RepID=UPI00110FCDD7|nr:MBL fold metallo-hydrolase [Streptomyces sp. DASNCL29]TMU98480.1 MBL fold metallo-hydrolase [Streptomyces sp. DASNCL29]